MDGRMEVPKRNMGFAVTESSKKVCPGDCNNTTATDTGNGNMVVETGNSNISRTRL